MSKSLSPWRRLLWTGLSLVVLPLLGIRLAGRPARTYLEFPPLTRYVDHAPFSWVVFGSIAALFVTTLALLTVGLMRGWARGLDTGCRWTKPSRWGICAGAFLLVTWGLAWTRLPYAASFQHHTFTPLWFAAIMVINALTHMRKGTCLLTGRPFRYAALFPVSAAFWWYFEYLNRFVQNWYYLNIDGFGRLEYGLFATLSFSTVLPASVSTVELLRTFSAVEYGFRTARGWSPRHPRLVGVIAIAIGAIVLASIGARPDPFFAVLWLGPILIWWGGQVLTGEDAILPRLSEGDWRPLAIPALAALLCGFAWELWNVGSLARWEYSVPYVQRFRLFAMPLLGYMGYLPFGVECSLVADEVLLANASPGWCRKLLNPRVIVALRVILLVVAPPYLAFRAVHSLLHLRSPPPV